MKFHPNKPAMTGSQSCRRKSQNKKDKQMKNKFKKSIVGCSLVATLALSGCASTKPLPPSFYGAAARLAFDAGTHDNPSLRGQLTLAAGMLCQATRESSLDPVTFQHAINTDNYSVETVAVIRGVQLVYIAAISSLSDTNRATFLPYAEAVFCNLTDVPSSGPAMRGLPPVPVYSPDPRFPISVKRH